MNEPVCLKCNKGILLPVDRVVYLGHQPVPEGIAVKQGWGYSMNDILILTEYKGIIRVWRCSNPECSYEVK